MRNDTYVLLNDLKKLLLEDGNGTQESICAALEAKGHQVNQSKVSRLLRKINAIKSKNAAGDMVYCLPHDAEAPPVSSALSELVLDIQSNENMIVIQTSPGAASLIARVIDHKKCQVLGTIAGDDTIFVAPNAVASLQHTLQLIKDCLG